MFEHHYVLIAEELFHYLLSPDDDVDIKNLHHQLLIQHQMIQMLTEHHLLLELDRLYPNQLRLSEEEKKRYFEGESEKLIYFKDMISYC